MIKIVEITQNYLIQIDGQIKYIINSGEIVYIPFSKHKRACLGRQFAYIEMLTVMAILLKKYDIKNNSLNELDVKEAGTLIVPKLKLQFNNINEKIK